MTAIVDEQPARAAVPAMSARLTNPFQRGADVLELVLQAGATPAEAQVLAYSFVEHQARFGRPPTASYVLRAVAPVPAAAVVEVDLIDATLPGGATTVSVPLPRGAVPGDGFAIPIPGEPRATARLTALRLIGGVGAVGDCFAVTALLGTTARLLWVLGVERDRLSRIAREVRTQRTVARATGASLDLIGADLAVPRFPPTPYSFDAATVALYHLDEAPGASPAVVDATAIFPGRTAHHGLLTGAAGVGQRGRYDRAVGFAGNGGVVVGSHADFDIGTDEGFTVECFVRPAVASTLGTVVSRAAGAQPQWALEVGDIGLGVPQAVRASISDGISTLVVTGAVGIPTDRFTHVAAVLDRNTGQPGTGRLSLIVDGTSVADSTGNLGALSAAGDVTIGPGSTGFRGIVDEVRISRVARRSFAPALGEADDHYRDRLTLFRQWILPTPTNLQRLLNALVPEIDGVAEPFVVDDIDGAARGGAAVLRVWPRAIPVRESIDGHGRLGIAEHELWSREDGYFDPALLGGYAHPRVTHAPEIFLPDRDPSLPPSNSRSMQPGPAAALDRLATLLDGAGFIGALTVLSGYDPAAPDSRAAGRAVRLAAPVIGPGRLAALAHRAGFDFVEHRADGSVYAACAPGREMLLGPPDTGALLMAGRLPEIVVGSIIELTLAQGTTTYAAPTLLPDTEVRFWLVDHHDRALLTSAGPSAGVAELTATAPGSLTVSADVSRAGSTVTVTTTVVARPSTLADGVTIAADGTLGVSLGVVGLPETDFEPAFLATVSDPRLVLGPNQQDRQMQRGVAETLLRLLDQLSADVGAGTVAVVSAFRPGAPATDLARVGRRLELRHSALSAGDFAVRAHRAGFGVVRRTGVSVVVAGPVADPVGVEGPTEVTVGDHITLTASPAPPDVSTTTRLGWSSGQLVATTADQQGVQLTSTTAPSVTVVGLATGRAWVRATLREAGAAGPYAFMVRLRPELAGARISRDDYYLLMNALHTVHPVGVEVLTEALRAAVVELGSTPSGLDPSFTYPAFRLHRAAAAIRKDISHG